MAKKLRLNIVGTHGVPANYGGFETLADFLCQNLSKEFDITVYCNAKIYPIKQAGYFGAKLKYVNIEANGIKGIFYDLYTYINALINADVILYLSPVGSGFMTPLKRIFPGKKVIVNHGGLNEWEREKLSWVQKKWAKFNHKVAAKFSDINIVDNCLYQTSLKSNFNADSLVIKYGGDHVVQVKANDARFVNKYPFVKYHYAVSISRAQLDNNIHIVLNAFEIFSDFKIVLISNWNISKYGKELKEKYKSHENIILLDAIYDKEELDFIRGNAWVYIHSHSRCGTAPSLVEAMNLGKAIISFNVPTNFETTQGKAIFFSDSSSLIQVLEELTNEKLKKNRIAMKEIAAKEYTWKIISQQYREVFKS